MRKLIILALRTAPALLPCRVLGEMGTRHSNCEDTAVIRAESPDGKYAATVYHRRCGPEGSESFYTYAKVKEVPPHFWSDPEAEAAAGRFWADMGEVLLG